MDRMALLDDEPEAERAEAEMFADMVKSALLTHFDGIVRPMHRVAVGRLLRGGSALALVAALDAAREMAAHRESRTVVRNAFILALTEREAPPVPPAASAEELAQLQAAAEAHAKAVGPDAYLLERMADERAAFADDAAGIDPAEERQAREDASRLRNLARRHAVHYIGRDVAPRPPFVEETGADPERAAAGA
jgi:hypothetical protein